MEFNEVISDKGLPTRFGEVALLREYIDRGQPHGDAIYLSLGETWTEVAPGLASTLSATLPTRSHGHVVSQYGLPRLHRMLREYIPRTHELPLYVQPGHDFEVAVACSGTRNSMYDFARLVAGRESSGRRPVGLVFTPAWDYATVLTAAGFEIASIALDSEDGFHPPIDRARVLAAEIARDPSRRPALLVIKPQHNPTAVNWREQDVRGLIRLCSDAGMAVLIDDAYYAVHDAGIKPTSALRVLLEEFRQDRVANDIPWLAVRSLGKQFNCNGWGIGAITGHPGVIDHLVNDVQFERSFMAAVPLQEAMAAWLASGRADAYLEDRQSDLARKREAVATALPGLLGISPTAFTRGECTTYLRFPAPHASDAVEVQLFRDETFRRTGVLLGLDPNHGDVDQVPWIRMFLGPQLAVLEEALSRLAAARVRHIRTVSTR